ncbi:hypothetical protein EVAR_39845_1 [Eumeta japonica]|uniref:Uncharacterized protein n=1 Tax=Eumeta variegata TaxID=151549 RepID=A0A4C1WQY9_EUMVA|nr:hypothetical protein EVAR_39845_1 [Eumeta japonica]
MLHHCAHSKKIALTREYCTLSCVRAAGTKFKSTTCSSNAVTLPRRYLLRISDAEYERGRLPGTRALPCVWAQTHSKRRNAHRLRRTHR